MPAGLGKHDTMMSVRETPWHGLGVVLKKEPKTIDEAIKKAGLDWDVVQVPAKYTWEGKTRVITDEDGDPMFFSNVRADTGQVLGMVTDRYTPVQNRAAFSFLASIFGSEMHFETAGSLMGGRRGWVMMKLPDWVEVGGDPIGQFAFISNSHDGKSSVLAAMTPIRIVCQNTLGAALGRAIQGKAAQRTYTIRHLGDMSAKIAEARNVMDVTINYYEQFKHVGDKLALAKLSEKRLTQRILEPLFPIEEGMGDRAAKNREEARAAVLSIFKGVGSAGDTTGNAPGTKWCAFNAIGEYADWGREERKDGGRFQRAIDDPDSVKRRGFELVVSA